MMPTQPQIWRIAVHIYLLSVLQQRPSDVNALAAPDQVRALSSDCEDCDEHPHPSVPLPIQTIQLLYNSERKQILELRTSESSDMDGLCSVGAACQGRCGWFRFWDVDACNAGRGCNYLSSMTMKTQTPAHWRSGQLSVTYLDQGRLLAVDVSSNSFNITHLTQFPDTFPGPRVVSGSLSSEPGSQFIALGSRIMRFDSASGAHTVYGYDADVMGVRGVSGSMTPIVSGRLLGLVGHMLHRVVIANETFLIATRSDPQRRSTDVSLWKAEHLLQSIEVAAFDLSSEGPVWSSTEPGEGLSVVGIGGGEGHTLLYSPDGNTSLVQLTSSGMKWISSQSLDHSSRASSAPACNSNSCGQCAATGGCVWCSAARKCVMGGAQGPCACIDGCEEWHWNGGLTFGGSTSKTNYSTPSWCPVAVGIVPPLPAGKPLKQAQAQAQAQEEAEVWPTPDPHLTPCPEYLRVANMCGQGEVPWLQPATPGSKQAGSAQMSSFAHNEGHEARGWQETKPDIVNVESDQGRTARSLRMQNHDLVLSEVYNSAHNTAQPTATLSATATNSPPLQTVKFGTRRLKRKREGK